MAPAEPEKNRKNYAKIRNVQEIWNLCVYTFHLGSWCRTIWMHYDRMAFQMEECTGRSNHSCRMDPGRTYCPADIDRDFSDYPIKRKNSTEIVKIVIPICKWGQFGDYHQQLRSQYRFALGDPFSEFVCSCSDILTPDDN